MVVWTRVELGKMLKTGYIMSCSQQDLRTYWIQNKKRSVKDDLQGLLSERGGTFRFCGGVTTDGAGWGEEWARVHSEASEFGCLPNQEYCWTYKSGDWTKRSRKTKALLNGTQYGQRQRQLYILMGNGNLHLRVHIMTTKEKLLSTKQTLYRPCLLAVSFLQSCDCLQMALSP